MKVTLEPLDEVRYRIPKTGGMRVEGIVYADRKLVKTLKSDGSLQQVANVAHLPGIVKASLAMPDIHQGYGFPIGGVAAMDAKTGVISPGGVGYDINCGCRVVAGNLSAEEVKEDFEFLLNELYRAIPCGVRGTGRFHLSKKEIKQVLKKGARWAVEKGLGDSDDLENTEDTGVMESADPSVVSDYAIRRGLDQLGTLGSGNHFLELSRVETIYDDKTARRFGLFEGQLVVFIHSGSRGLGYQVCDDFLHEMVKRLSDLPFSLPDRQLACAPLSSDIGKRYFAAMACAANYAWANRQVLMTLAIRALETALHVAPREHGFRLLYDVCHNIAKMETHAVKGKPMRVCVHRKGATRAFPAGHPDLPRSYRDTGQPVLIPGDMGTASYILVAQPGAMAETFGSTCHGAGRVLSRSQAIKRLNRQKVLNFLSSRGIAVRARGKKTLLEEAPDAYKDIDRVAAVVERAGISSRVARLVPMGVIKG